MSVPINPVQVTRFLDKRVPVTEGWLYYSLQAAKERPHIFDVHQRNVSQLKLINLIVLVRNMRDNMKFEIDCTDVEISWQK